MKLLLFIVLLITSPALVAGMEDRKWHRYTTDNFVLLTDLKPKLARERLEELELFRAVVLKITSAQPRQDVVPMKVFLFSRARDFRVIANRPSIIGFMRPTLRANYLVSSSDSGGAAQTTIIYHEYVHYLLRDGASNYPQWFDEGLADFLSTVFVKDDRVVVGAESKMRVETLINAGVYLPLARVVNRDGISNLHRYLGSYFYAMAWATVNYIYTGHMADRPSHLQGMNDYLQLVNAGEDRASAFEAAFGMTPREMEDDVNDFLRKRQRPVMMLPVDRFGEMPSPTVERMTTRDIVYELGYLAMQSNPSLAHKMFKKSVKAEPGNRRHRVAMAVSLQMQGEYAAAIALAREAIGEDDYLLHLELGDMLSEWCRKDDAPDDCNALRIEAGNHYESALALAPGNPEVKAAYGRLLGEKGESLDTAVGMLRSAHAVMPSSIWLTYQLGHAEFLNGDVEAAIPLLLRAYYWSHSESLSKLIEEDLAAIDPDLVPSEEE